MSRQSFRSEVLAWAARLDVAPRGIYIQRMTRKWGSCSVRGRVCFASDLLSESTAFRAAVIVHELLHLSVPNHGKLFRSLMSAYLPGWQDVRSGVERILCGRIRSESDGATTLLRQARAN